MLERMVFYGQTGQCRWKVLLEPFGDGDGFGTCGHCDNCMRIALATATAAAAASAAAPAEVAPEPPPARPPFAPGDAVRVARYGRGIVAAVDGEGVTVRFDEGASRVFLADYVRPAGGEGRSEGGTGGPGPPGCRAARVSEDRRSSAPPDRSGEGQKWPQTLWVVRHGQSAGNVARDAAEAAGLADITIAERDVDVPLVEPRRAAVRCARPLVRRPRAGAGADGRALLALPAGDADGAAACGRRSSPAAARGRRWS